MHRRMIQAALAAAVALGGLGCQKAVYLTHHFDPSSSARMRAPAQVPALAGSRPEDMFFKDYGVRPPQQTDRDRLSTFAMDVDTGSYTLCRSYLNRGHLPPAQAAEKSPELPDEFIRKQLLAQGDFQKQAKRGDVKSPLGGVNRIAVRAFPVVKSL